MDRAPTQTDKTDEAPSCGIAPLLNGQRHRHFDRMGKPAMVRIYRDDRAGLRADVGRMAVADLFAQMRCYLPPHLFEQFQNDLTVLGRARVNADRSICFEYEIVGGDREG